MLPRVPAPLPAPATRSPRRPRRAQACDRRRGREERARLHVSRDEPAWLPPAQAARGVLPDAVPASCFDFCGNNAPRSLGDFLSMSAWRARTANKVDIRLTRLRKFFGTMVTECLMHLVP